MNNQNILGLSGEDLIRLSDSLNVSDTTDVDVSIHGAATSMSKSTDLGFHIPPNMRSRSTLQDATAQYSNHQCPSYLNKRQMERFHTSTYYNGCSTPSPTHDKPLKSGYDVPVKNAYDVSLKKGSTSKIKYSNNVQNDVITGLYEHNMTYSSSPRQTYRDVPVQKKKFAGIRSPDSLSGYSYSGSVDSRRHRNVPRGDLGTLLDAARPAERFGNDEYDNLNSSQNLRGTQRTQSPWRSFQDSDLATKCDSHMKNDEPYIKQGLVQTIRSLQSNYEVIECNLNLKQQKLSETLQMLEMCRQDRRRDAEQIQKYRNLFNERDFEAKELRSAVESLELLVKSLEAKLYEAEEHYGELSRQQEQDQTEENWTAQQVMESKIEAKLEELREQRRANEELNSKLRAAMSENIQLKEQLERISEEVQKPSSDVSALEDKVAQMKTKLHDKEGEHELELEALKRKYRREKDELRDELQSELERKVKMIREKYERREERRGRKKEPHKKPPVGISDWTGVDLDSVGAENIKDQPTVGPDNDENENKSAMSHSNMAVPACKNSEHISYRHTPQRATPPRCEVTQCHDAIAQPQPYHGEPVPLMPADMYGTRQYGIPMEYPPHFFYPHMMARPSTILGVPNSQYRPDWVNIPPPPRTTSLSPRHLTGNALPQRSLGLNNPYI